MFELVDSVRIDIPYEFGFVSKSTNDGFSLIYTYVDEKFHVLNSNFEQVSSFRARGEGPKEYSGILPFAGLYEGKVFFLDHQNLFFFTPSGDFISATPYNDPSITSFGGIPDSELFFVNDSIFIVPNIHIVDLSRVANKEIVLDTVPIWISYKLSRINNTFERYKLGKASKASPFFNDLSYTNYRSHILYNEGSVIQIPKIGGKICVYSLEFPGQIKSVDLNLPGFKFQRGLEEDRVTPENYKLFNQMALESSFISYLVSLDKNILFLFYKAYVDNDPRLTLRNHGLNYRLQGFYIDVETEKSSQVDVPWNMDDAFNRVIYLGQNKFLWVLPNETERDYHEGKIYQLVDTN
ncbi:hypothetical protein [Algoriphagus namhaensis]